ncbi:VaFE repeat-containing surface-anchored protein [Listeria booriae]|uniref:VaFE repeat-containing surface-anchored protein n=1 Tax=Listeria booriae TaxID=1552123 RepID=UPI0016255EF0|nr:VaFE repeat-containing surface-anchored protein [Listeria booriae]MBC1333768.1 VaFE repeat-containing surface-anchored protein [Listeria booriae]
MKKNFKKAVVIMLLCVLVINQVSMQLIASAAGEKQWGGEFLTSTEILDSNGNPISDIPVDSGFKVRYNWEIPNDIDVDAGDRMQVTLPAQLKTAQNVQMDFKDDNGVTVAVGQATAPGSQEYNVTFTNYPETHSNVAGYFEFYVRFSDDVNPGEEIELDFDIPGEGPIKITPGEPGGGGPPGETEPGEVVPDMQYKTGYLSEDGKSIEWYITFIPPNLKENESDPGYYKPLSNVSILDTHGPGQKLIENTVRVRQAFGKTNGQAGVGSELGTLDVQDYDQTAGTFRVDLGDLVDGYGRQIIYKTEITDATQEEFTNKAKVTATDYDKDSEFIVRIEGGEGGAEGTQAGFTVVKEDNNGNALPGAKFDLFRISNGEPRLIQAGLVSDENGRVSYNGLKFGTYELRETEAPEGFVLLEEPYRFELNKAGMQELTIPIVNVPEETPVGSVKLIKYDEADESKGLEGAEFDLFRGTPGSGTLVSSNHTTDNTGTFQVNNLEFGDYYFVETKAPAGYELDATPRPFTIGEDQVTVPFEVKVANKKVEEPVGSVELIKYDEADESKGLAGAEFDLFRGTPGSGTLVSKHTTDDTGAFQVNNLEFGDYYFVETKAPAGYELDATPRPFTIGEKEVTVPFVVKVANKKVEEPVGSVNLLKHDEADESMGLEGAEFDLFRGIPGSGELVSKHTTDNTGAFQVNNLEFGDYYFVETKAPAGYELDATPRPFTIGEKEVTVPFVVKVANKKVEEPVGSVNLLKHDEADESMGLEGAEFDLFRGIPGSGELVSKHTTDNTGTFQVNNLEFGDYYFVETKAPAGYELDATPRPFTIGEKEVTVPFVVKVANKAIVDPAIQTVAFETSTENKILFPGEAAKISDRVSYNNVIPGKAYRLDATLLTKNSALQLTTGQKQFTATSATGQEVVDLAAFDATALRGQQVVVFEQLIDVESGLIVATHEDLNDADQTVSFADPRGGVTFTKVDADTQNPLAGAEFTLYEGTSSAPGNALGVYTSAATTGKVTVNDLPYGNYHFVETKAPAGGYILDGKAIDFEIVSDTTVLELDNVTNKRDYQPQIETLAFETGTNNKVLYPGMATQISDRVTYEQLTPGKNYRLEAKLMTKDGQTVLTQGTKTFTATTENGEEVVALDAFDARALKGQQVVVFERLIDTATNEVVATHEDLNDADQTVAFLVPSLQTFAFETSTGLQHDIHPHQNVELSDRVVYTNLNPGERYTLEATLVDKLTGNTVFTQGTHEFIPTTASGEVTVPLNALDATDLKGNAYVVFEVLKDESGQVIAEHTDKDSLTQTVSFIEPSIGTVARDKETGESNVHAGPITIVDEVQYQNLDTTQTYDIEGILMDKATNQPLLVDGQTVTATKSFSPANTDGTEEIEFTLDASQLKGKDIVVFETLKLNGAVVAVHQDINDAKQTIKVVDPAIGTTLRDEETATQTPSPEEDVTLVDVVKYENLIPGREYTVKGILMDKATEAPLVIDGEQVEAETTFTPETANGEVEVTFTFNAKGLAGQEVVAFERLYQNGKEVAVHTDINDANQTVKFKTPEIGTTATDQNGEKELNADNEVTVIDVVDYKDLIAGKEYTLQGILMDKATNAPVLVNGEEVHGETTFTPENADGSVEVTFTFDASDLYGKDLVVFEKLMRNGKEVVNHEDIDDEGQTVVIKNPEIGTTLRDVETGTQAPSPEEEISLVDVVKYENLTPGREYTVKGILMDKSTEAPLLVDGEQVEAETTFTPETANGEVEVTFTFNAKGLAGQEVVAFERLYQNGKEVAVHTDINDANQTVKFKTPEIGTTATDQNGEKELNADNEVTVIDVVDYKDLIAGKEYTLQGILMDKATNAPVLVNGEEVHGETTFTPENADGSVEVTFTFDASDLYGKDLVVFEKLMRNGKEVVNHEDIDDEGQTVVIKNPEIGTTLRDVETGTQAPSPEEEISLVDVVKYENLTPGREYTVKGILMDKSTEAPLLVDGEQVEAETTFTPETPNGEVEVTFTFNAKALAGQEVVAFERLYTDGKEVAVHTDINDADQTVKFTKPDLKTIATDQNGDKEIMPEEKVTIIDKVSYEDLIVGKEYTVTGKLMDKATGKPVLSNGKEVLGETTFTPEEPSGVVEVAFDLDARELGGSEVVVFEKLFRNGKEVVAHEDINDLDQTVRFIKKPDPENPGQPENPGNPGQPEQPENPGQPETPQKPENPSKPDNGSSKLEKKEETGKDKDRTTLMSKLPKTGDSLSLLTLLFGSLLVAIGAIVFLNKRKQNR